MNIIKNNLNLIKIIIIICIVACIPILIVWTSFFLDKEFQSAYMYIWNYFVMLIPVFICFTTVIVAKYIGKITGNYRVNVYVSVFLVTGILLLAKSNVELVILNTEMSLFAKYNSLMMSNVELLVLSVGLFALDNHYLEKILNRSRRNLIETSVLLYILCMGLAFGLSIIVNNSIAEIFVTVAFSIFSLSCVYVYLLKNKYKDHTKYTINAILGYAFIVFSRIMMLIEPINMWYNFLPNAYAAIGFIILLRKFLFVSIGSSFVEINEYRNKTEQEMAELKESMAETTREIKEANIKLLKNLDDAQIIQHALINRDMPRFSQLDFAYQYLSCEQVGGDFYQIVKLDDQRVGIFFGDVSGHGVSSAMINVFISQNVRFKMEYENGHTQVFTPRGVLSHLYHLYNTISLPEETYVVSCYGIYNVETHIFEYSSAGLNVKPIIIKKDGKTVPVDMSGFPICSFDKNFRPDYENYKVIIEPGESLIFYSDGLTEIDRKRPDLLSEENLLTFLSNLQIDSAEDTTNTLINKYYELRGKRKILDDVTILTMKVKEE